MLSRQFSFYKPKQLGACVALTDDGQLGSWQLVDVEPQDILEVEQFRAADTL